MKSIVKHSIWLFLVGVLICLPAQGFAVTFMIGSGDILPDAVQTSHIAPSAVTNDKIATGTITQDKLAFTLSGSRFANVVVVAKSGGDFTDPIAAVNSITTASAATPYVVKVMPGVYDLGTASLQMKEYVDIEGSGPDNTVITSSNTNIDADVCTVATVVMANNSSIRQIKAVNMPPAASGFTQKPALGFNNVKAKAEGISVLAGSDTVNSGGRNNGICIYGNFSNAVLNNVNIETHNNGGHSDPIGIYEGGSLTITNSKLAGFNNNGTVHAINSCCDGVAGSIIVNNTTMEATTSTGVNMLYLVAGFKVSIANSSFLSDNSVSYSVDPASSVRIANSLLTGDLSGLSNARFVNNYDQNFNPIPNQ